MTGGAIVAMLVGLVIPALVALVTRATLPVWLRHAILLLLSTATGVLTALVTSAPATLSQWEHVVLNIIVAFLCAEAAAAAGRETTVLAKIHKVSDPHFGLGPRPPAADELPRAA